MTGRPRLAELGSDPGSVLTVLRYFDALADGGRGTEDILAAVAELAGCPVVVDAGIARLERRGPAHPLDELVADRLSRLLARCAARYRISATRHRSRSSPPARRTGWTGVEPSGCSASTNPGTFGCWQSRPTCRRPSVWSSVRCPADASPPRRSAARSRCYTRAVRRPGRSATPSRRRLPPPIRPRGRVPVIVVRGWGSVRRQGFLLRRSPGARRWERCGSPPRPAMAATSSPTNGSACWSCWRGCRPSGSPPTTTSPG